LNPASEQIQVNWGGAIPEYMLQVINSAGQIVFSQNVRRHDYIDVSNLAKGTYVFTFSNRLQHNEISKKVIIR
ncbi:MAG TPA: T9SS type A sorting domain-containing protein, partial [Bacteroidales bacterium]|nr:T9SS type A sorting domain-containing protein [Bacteroidales bacterium]